MCDSCGCGSDQVKISKPNSSSEHGYHHHGDHTHEHPHLHSHEHSRTIKIESNILQQNKLLAERNRGYFEARNLLVVNLVSSPGAGKTTLLEHSLNELKNEFPVFVIEGDQQTLNDANRIDATGTPVIQVNTGSGCHLDSEMINDAMKELPLQDNGVIFIENVGNLVCPSLFDLGEKLRVVLLSVTEGDDKPLKYPNIFENTSLCIITKTDLLPYVDFSIAKAKEAALHVNPSIKFIELNVKDKASVRVWIDWLISQK